MILLDTNVLIRVLRGDEAVGRHYCENLGDLAIPAMVLGEVRYGVEKSERREANARLLDALLESLPVMHTTDAIMRRFAELKALPGGKGKRIDDADVLIAATALTYGCPLVTANVRHFSRFDGLDLLDWSVQDWRWETLLSIRRGEWTFDGIMAHAEKIQSEIESGKGRIDALIAEVMNVAEVA